MWPFYVFFGSWYISMTRKCQKTFRILHGFMHVTKYKIHSPQILQCSFNYFTNNWKVCTINKNMWTKVDNQVIHDKINIWILVNLHDLHIFGVEIISVTIKFFEFILLSGDMFNLFLFQSWLWPFPPLEIFLWGCEWI